MTEESCAREPASTTGGPSSALRGRIRERRSPGRHGADSPQHPTGPGERAEADGCIYPRNTNFSMWENGEGLAQKARQRVRGGLQMGAGFSMLNFPATYEEEKINMRLLR
jgi:hypothetical protein